MDMLKTPMIYKITTQRSAVRWLGSCISIFLCLLFLSSNQSVAAIPLGYKRVHLFPRDDVQNCGPIEANTDFYGLGIRTGIYLQWLSSLLANLFLPEAIDNNLDTNTIFLLALFFAMCAAASGHVEGSRLSTPEILLLLQLSFGFLGSILTIWGYRTRVSAGDPVRFSLIGSTVRIALATLVASFSVWFWFIGVDPLEPTPGCQSVTFIFTQVSINQGVVIFYKIQSLLVAMLYIFFFVREYLLIGCFICYTALWTSLVALFSIVFSPRIEEQRWEGLRSDLEKMHKQGSPFPVHGGRLIRRGFRPAMSTLRTILLQWLRLSVYIFWYHANGRKSGSKRRPDLSTWLTPFLQPLLSVAKRSTQWLCLFMFGWYPSMGSIPASIQIKLKHVYCQFLAIFPSEDTLSKRPMRLLLYIMNALVIVWTIVAVELTILWNQIGTGVGGVYELRSPGQLIPLLIGVVSFLRVIHGLSIPLSSLGITDWYCELLDTTRGEHFRDIDEQDLRWLDLSTKEVCFTNGKSYTFEKHVLRRRHSITGAIENAKSNHGPLSGNEYRQREQMELDWRIHRLRNMNKRNVNRRFHFPSGMIRPEDTREHKGSDGSENRGWTSLYSTINLYRHDNHSRSGSRLREMWPEIVEELSKKDSFFALRLAICYTVYIIGLPFFALLAFKRWLCMHFPRLERRATETTLQLVEQLLAERSVYFQTVDESDHGYDNSRLLRKKKQIKSLFMKWVAENFKAFSRLSEKKMHVVNMVPLSLAISGRYMAYFMLKRIRKEMQEEGQDAMPIFNDQSSVQISSKGQVESPSDEVSAGMIADANAKQRTDSEIDEDLIETAVKKSFDSLVSALLMFFKSRDFIQSLQKRSLPLLVYHMASYAETIFGDRVQLRARDEMHQIAEAVLHLEHVRREHKNSLAKQHYEVMKLWDDNISPSKWKEVYGVIIKRLREQKKDLLTKGQPLNTLPASRSRSRSSSRSKNSQDREWNRPSKIRRFSWPGELHHKEEWLGSGDLDDN